MSPYYSPLLSASITGLMAAHKKPKKTLNCSSYLYFFFILCLLVFIVPKHGIFLKIKSNTYTNLICFFLILVYFLNICFEISFKAKTPVTDIALMLLDFFMNTLNVPS